MKVSISMELGMDERELLDMLRKRQLEYPRTKRVKEEHHATTLARKNKANILEIIQKLPGVMTKDIIQRTGLSAPTVYTLCTQLHNYGLIENKGKRKKAQWHYKESSVQADNEYMTRTNSAESREETVPCMGCAKEYPESELYKDMCEYCRIEAKKSWGTK